MKRFDEVEETLMHAAITKCINEETKNNKLKIRNYLKAIFKDNSNYDLETMIKEAQNRADKIFM